MRKDRSDPEFAIQKVVFQHLRERGVARSFAFHVPNGGKRDPIAGARFKSQGVVAGVPDVIIVREGQTFALELKTFKGKLSEPQIRCLEQLEAAGAICHVAYGLNDALAWLESNRLINGASA